MKSARQRTLFANFIRKVGEIKAEQQQQQCTECAGYKEEDKHFDDSQIEGDPYSALNFMKNACQRTLFANFIL